MELLKLGSTSGPTRPLGPAGAGGETKGGRPHNIRKQTKMTPQQPPPAAPKLVRRKCCPGGSASFIEPRDVDASLAYRWRADPAPVLEEIKDESPPRESTAWHEAGHAVFGHFFGMPIDVIRVCPPAMVRYARGNNLTAPQRIAINYAGHIGEMARLRCWSTLRPEEEDEYLDRASEGSGGGCDECKMAADAWLSAGRSAGKEAAREAFRAGQMLALQLGQRRDVQQAIRALAGQLMERHTLTGAAAHAIIENYLEFGELKDTTK